jgi:hypothetical protein
MEGTRNFQVELEGTYGPVAATRTPVHVPTESLQVPWQRPIHRCCSQVDLAAMSVGRSTVLGLPSLQLACVGKNGVVVLSKTRTEMELLARARAGPPCPLPLPSVSFQGPRCWNPSVVLWTPFEVLRTRTSTHTKYGVNRRPSVQTGTLRFTSRPACVHRRRVRPADQTDLQLVG